MLYGPVWIHLVLSGAWYWYGSFWSLHGNGFNGCVFMYPNLWRNSDVAPPHPPIHLFDFVGHRHVLTPWCIDPQLQSSQSDRHGSNLNYASDVVSSTWNCGTGQNTSLLFVNIVHKILSGQLNVPQNRDKKYRPSSKIYIRMVRKLPMRYTPYILFWITTLLWRIKAFAV